MKPSDIRKELERKNPPNLKELKAKAPKILRKARLLAVANKALERGWRRSRRF